VQYPRVLKQIWTPYSATLAADSYGMSVSSGKLPTFLRAQSSASGLRSAQCRQVYIYRENWRRQLQQGVPPQDGRRTKGHRKSPTPKCWPTSTYHCIGSGNYGVCPNHIGYIRPKSSCLECYRPNPCPSRIHHQGRSMRLPTPRSLAGSFAAKKG
jgi:hypothetical protein